MHQYKRYELLRSLLNQHPVVSIEIAMAVTGASHATTRRDFDNMAEQGMVERVRGGIRRITGGEMPSYQLREAQQSPEKEKIARKAAELLQPGQVIMVDGGSTTFHLAHYLPAFALTVLTNSLRLATELDTLRRLEPLQHPGLEIYLTGGRLHPDSGGLLVGQGAVNTLENYRADWAFLSVGGVNEEGLFNTSESVVEVERRMMRQAERCVVLADRTKLGRSSMARLAGLDAISRLITDEAPPPPVAAALAQAGVDVRTCFQSIGNVDGPSCR